MVLTLIFLIIGTATSYFLEFFSKSFHSPPLAPLSSIQSQLEPAPILESEQMKVLKQAYFYLYFQGFRPMQGKMFLFLGSARFISAYLCFSIH